MTKHYDATQEFRPFERSKDVPKLHPNKEHARVLKRRKLAEAKADALAKAYGE